jgi:deoxyadenosine/deoxycytidine kinase
MKNLVKHRCILVEGMPGTGKSTTSQALATQLTANGVPVRWFYEKDKQHPFMPDYGVKFELIEDLFRALLGKWQAYVAGMSQGDDVIILDAAFLQNPIQTMLYLNIPQQMIQQFVGMLYQVIKPLNPLLVYLDIPAVERHMKKLIDSRDEEWETEVLDNLKRSKYAGGRDMFIRFIQDSTNISKSIYQQLGMDKIVIDRTKISGSQCIRQINQQLNIPYMQPTQLSPQALEKYTGAYSYYDGEHLNIFWVEIRQNQLYIIDCPYVWATGNALLWKKEHTFSPESWPFEFEFSEDKDGNIVSLKMIQGQSNWEIEDQVFRKIET